MKKILAVVVAAAVTLLFVGATFAGGELAYKPPARTGVEKSSPAETTDMPAAKPDKQKVRASDFPTKGWHKGPYLAANIGMMQATNDTHAVTGLKFDGSFDMNFGLTFGWDIADWIGPMLQVNFATATGTAGDPNNNAAAVTYANGVNYPAGTFPTQDARQYAVDISIFAKATLPYFTRAEWQWKNLKIIPYAKLGGTGYGMIVNASNNNNKIGAYGGGPAVGAGVEFFVWKGLFFALDFTENLIIQGSYKRTINNVNTEVVAGGFKPQFVLNGLIGWHF